MSVNINADTTNGLVLTSDTSGELKLQSAGADIATVDSSGITMAAGKTLPASALTGSLPAGMGGKILQVVQATKTTLFSTTSTSFTDITGLSATITPSSTSSKILVISMCPIHGGDNDAGHVKWLRGSTTLLVGTSVGSRVATNATGWNYGQEGNMPISTFTYLDSPSTTSATTYKAQMRSAGGGTVAVNGAALTNDTSYYGRGASTIVLLEVSG